MFQKLINFTGPYYYFINLCKLIKKNMRKLYLNIYEEKKHMQPQASNNYL